MRIQVLKAIHRLLQKIFKDRDVIVRSEGHVRYYTISRRSQMWLLAPFALFFLWLAGASIGFASREIMRETSEKRTRA